MTFVRFASIALGITVAAVSQAQSVAGMSFTGGTLANNTITAGWRFDIASGTSIKLTHLGWYDVNAPGNNWNNVPIKVWNRTTQAELASSTILNTSTKDSDGFRYVALTNQVTLGPGSYVIGGFGKNYMTGATAVTSNIAGVTFGGRALAGGNALAFPTSFNTTSKEYFGPNFKAQAVPEPATIGLLGVGVAFLARRRKTARAAKA